jgi:hypothetical protein
LLEYAPLLSSRDTIGSPHLTIWARSYSHGNHENSKAATRKFFNKIDGLDDEKYSFNGANGGMVAEKMDPDFNITAVELELEAALSQIGLKTVQVRPRGGESVNSSSSSNTNINFGMQLQANQALTPQQQSIILSDDDEEEEEDPDSNFDFEKEMHALFLLSVTKK